MVKKLLISIALSVGVSSFALATPQPDDDLFLATELMANQGDAEAQHKLGDMYRFGKVVPKSYEKAIGWYEKAAKQGYAHSQFILGLIYIKTDEDAVTQDYQKAIEWLELASQQNYAPAQHRLGTMYNDGKGVEKNPYRARDLLESAAKQGDKIHQLTLALFYERGSGIKMPPNYAKAAEWYEKAAMQGLGIAQYNLGSMYAADIGGIVPKNYTKAHEWLKKAADQGIEVAMYQLGQLHEEGRGVPINLDIAKDYYHQSCEKNLQRSCDRYRILTE